MENHSFVRFYGGMKVDGFKVSKNNLDKNSILEDYQLLTTDTVIMNNYTRKLEADYVSSDSILSDRGFYLYKKTPFQNYYNYVGKLEGNAFTFIDYNIVSQEYYHYLATLERETSDGLVYISYENLNDLNEPVYLKATWDKFSICDIDFDEEKSQYIVSSEVWLFNCNVEANQITQNTSVTSWDTLGKYQKVSIGKRKYDSGTMSCLLGEVTQHISDKNQGKNIYGYTERINKNSIYSSENEKEVAWKNFISNGKTKLFKDTKGNKWIVQILENNGREINYKAIGKITKISFDWIEIEDSSLYPIVGDAKNNYEL